MAEYKRVGVDEELPKPTFNKPIAVNINGTKPGFHRPSKHQSTKKPLKRRK